MRPCTGIPLPLPPPRAGCACCITLWNGGPGGNGTAVLFALKRGRAEKSAYFVFWDSVLDAVAEGALAGADGVLGAEETLEGAEDAGAAFGAIASCAEERGGEQAAGTSPRCSACLAENDQVEQGAGGERSELCERV